MQSSKIYYQTLQHTSYRVAIAEYTVIQNIVLRNNGTNPDSGINKVFG